MSTICTYLRPDIANMAGYTPGEQPRVANILKLHTNENPYPPPPAALAAIGAPAGLLANPQVPRSVGNRLPGRGRAGAGNGSGEYPHRQRFR